MTTHTPLAALDTLTPVERAELAAYTQRGFAPAVAATLPLAAEPHVAAWEGYMAHAAEAGVFPALQAALVQLNFPIEADISQSDPYRAATRRGVFPLDAAGPVIATPQGLRLELHPGVAGPIPVITAGDRQDFVTLVRALSQRNEPTPVPNSMGATMIAGLVNWQRIQARRDQWEETPGEHDTWEEAFEALKADKPAYQDRLILLSEGPYSGVPAASLGLADEAWRTISLALRREHEYTHYFTRRVLGSMRNNILDELIADASGLLAATGTFKASWFLAFMGLENYPHYREGGRLQNYRGEPALSDGAFRGLMALTVAAAQNLEAALTDGQAGQDPLDRARLVLALSALTLDELAAPGGGDRLER